MPLVIVPTRICREDGCERYAAPRRQWCGGCCYRRDELRRKQDNSKKNHRKRARLYGGRYELVNAQRVFERDGWICGICRDLIDRRRQHPDLMCATLDHVVPLSEGGDHSYANTRAAHSSCNTARGNRGGGEQLVLIG